jgi:hypothetical protein
VTRYLGPLALSGDVEGRVALGGGVSWVKAAAGVELGRERSFDERPIQPFVGVGVEVSRFWNPDGDVSSFPGAYDVDGVHLGPTLSAGVRTRRLNITAKVFGNYGGNEGAIGLISFEVKLGGKRRG